MIIVRKMVLDVLKPISPSLLELATRLCAVKGIDLVECTIIEIDRETESIKIVIEGNGIQYPVVENVIASFGAAVHSLDSVTTKRVPDKHKAHPSKTH